MTGDFPMRDSNPTAQQARRLAADGRAGQARSLLARALQKNGADPDLNGAMAEVLAAQGQHARAIYYSDRVVHARPQDPAAHAVHGTLLLAAGNQDGAAAAFERAVSLAPDMHEARVNLAGVLLMQERYGSALEHCLAAMAGGFDHPFLTATYTSVLRCTGRIEEALPLIRAAAAKHPDQPLLAESLASALNFAPGADPQETLRAHVARGRQIEQAAAPHRATVRPAPEPSPADADRRLRIGIVSPDLRSHSVAYFAEPILRHLDRAAFEVRCYFTGGFQDSTTPRLRSIADVWRDCGTLDDPALARLLRSDALDIALELSGHSSGNRLAAMALRPAPVQITCIGYPNTTGLSAMDGRIVDGLTDPPGTDSLAVEKLHRLDPCFLCYQPPESLPAAPCHRGPGGPDFDATCAFGSFNNLQKINESVVSLWARLVQRVPSSRLLLKSPGMREESVREQVRARFAARGISPDRIEALPPTAGLAEHLASYAHVDIALDTFPYCGTTTTCEAMLMGVPVVSLVGSTHAARVGLSLLSAVGLSDLAASTEDEYIDRAGALAADRTRLAGLRSTMRDRLLASPLCDGPAYGRRLGVLLREVWRERCRAAVSPHAPS